MKTIFDKVTRDGLIDRINSLSENNTAQWGKMNVFQMLKHCTKWEEMALGKVLYKQVFLGKLFGKMGLKDFLSNEDPFKKNVPTMPEFKIKELHGNVAGQKQQWIALMQQYETASNENIVHPFFGKLTKEQWGQLAYKHTDHHLRQFGA